MKTHIITRAAAPALALIVWLLLPQPAHSYYNPSTGRWLSRDPIEESGGKNLYGFAVNDPIRKSDRLGLEVLCYYDDRGVWTCRSPLEKCKKCTCKKATVTPASTIHGTVGPAPPSYPPDARALNVGLPTLFKVEYDGDPSLCKCKHKDSGSIEYSYTLSFSDGQQAPNSGTETFDKPSDTHEFACDKPDNVVDWPGPAPVIGPLSGSITYDLTYNMSVTVTCEGSDGSKAEDSKPITGHYSGSYQWQAK